MKHTQTLPVVKLQHIAVDAACGETKSPPASDGCVVLNVRRHFPINETDDFQAVEILLLQKKNIEIAVGSL